MLLPFRTDAVRTFRVKTDGSIQEGDTIPLRNTLFAHAFGADAAALVRLAMPTGDGLEATAERLRLANALSHGVRTYQVLGSGHGVKAGKLWAATPEVVSKVHRHFGSAEDALAYGGLLFSESTHVLRLSSAKMTAQGDGDGQGWIDADVLRAHGLPARQIQVRALFDHALAKGTLLPSEGLAAREGVSLGTGLTFALSRERPSPSQGRPTRIHPRRAFLAGAGGLVCASVADGGSTLHGSDHAELVRGGAS